MSPYLYYINLPHELLIVLYRPKYMYLARENTQGHILHTKDHLTLIKDHLTYRANGCAWLSIAYLRASTPDVNGKLNIVPLSTIGKFCYKSKLVNRLVM